MIEILAALVPAAILVLTVGVMLFYAWRAWVENQAIVELQQDGAAVMAHIAHAVRIAGYTNVTTSTGQIEIQETNGVRRFVLDAETERLLLWTPSGGAPSPVTQQRVTRFEPLKEGEAAMRVEIVLGPPDGVITQQALFHSRN